MTALRRLLEFLALLSIDLIMMVALISFQLSPVYHRQNRSRQQYPLLAFDPIVIPGGRAGRREKRANNGYLEETKESECRIV